MNTPTWGYARAGTVVTRVKHVKKEEETSEGASNDAVVASLGRWVGGHSHVGASKGDFPEQKNIPARNGSAKTTGKYGELRFGDVAWRPVTREDWKPAAKPRSKRERKYKQQAEGWSAKVAQCESPC